MKTNISHAIFAFAIALGLFAAQSVSSALAQEADKTVVEVPAELSSEAISELVSKLDPDQIEALSGLIRLLNNSIGDDVQGSGSTQASTLDTLKNWLSDFGSTVVSYVQETP